MRIVLLSFAHIEYTIQLAEALSKLEDVMLIMPKNKVEKFIQVMEESVKMKPYYQPRIRYPQNLVTIYRIIKQINNFNPDIVHLQAGNPWFSLMLRLLKKKYPLVTTIHDVILHIGDKSSRKIPPFIFKLAVRYANQVIVHGENLKELMIKEYNTPPVKIHVVPRGVNSIYRRFLKKEVREEDYSILFFGRIWEYKGLRYLIEAEPLITKEVPTAKIVIAGRGEDFRKYQEMMVHKERFVIYNEYIPNEMVAELFQKASAVALPYIDASQSGVIPLAYAFKKPVVATDVGSIAEVVDDGETGYIVPPRDSKKLAEAVIDLLKDKEKRKKMGENAYKKTKEELSWENIAIKTVQVYKKALDDMR